MREGILGKNLQGKRNEQKVKQQPLGSKNYAISQALPDFLVKNKETHSRQRKFHRKLRLSKYFCFLLPKPECGRIQNTLCFASFARPKFPLYAFYSLFLLWMYYV